MPTSRAACTQASAASSSTWPPWVSQLPYAISEMFRPERPRRLNSTTPTLSPRPELDLGARGDVRLREPPATDHRRAADAVPGQPAGRLVTLREALGDLVLDAAAQDHGVDDHHEEEAEQQQAGVVLHERVGGDRADQRDHGDHQEEAADVAAGVDDVADVLAHRAAVAGRQVVVVTAGGGGAGR